MRETPKIVSLAAALAALGAQAAAPPIADAASANESPVLLSETETETQAAAEINLLTDAELMSFTVQQGSDGILFPQHGSHSSHASHASSSIGGGGSWPNMPYVPLPDPPYVPPVYAPDPTYAPPPAATTSPAPISASDPKYLACTGASNGLGVNQIASELEQTFGMAESDAVNMAQQALGAVLNGGHYCDGYLGDHE
jgi:hypothetical protein